MARGRIVGPGTFLKRSPNKFIGAIGAAASAIGGIAGLIGGNKAAGAAAAQQRAAQQ